MLKQRVLTAAILVPLALAGVFLLPVNGFGIFIGAIIAAGAWEWAKLAGLDKRWMQVLYSAAMALVCVVTAEMQPLNVLWFAAIWWLIASAWVFLYPKNTAFLSNRFVRFMMGFFTLVPGWFALYTLKQMPQAHLLIVMVFMMVWVADCGAYFFGKKFGRHKLMVRVSPKKTIEGFVGGIVSAIVAIILLTLFTENSFQQDLTLVALTAVTVLFSVMGDLWESVLKRLCDIKDSGSILPGHGGVLDRIDSLTAAAPIFTLIVLLMQGG